MCHQIPIRGESSEVHSRITPETADFRTCSKLLRECLVGSSGLIQALSFVDNQELMGPYLTSTLANGAVAVPAIIPMARNRLPKMVQK